VILHVQGDLVKLERSLNRRKIVTNVHRLDDELRVHVKGAADALPVVLDTVAKSGAVLTDLSVTVPTLETVFINLTGKELRD
jgi:ABC-2 type transport system ATP-binding protein